MTDDTKKVIDYDVFFAKWTREIPESEIRRLLRFQGQYYFAGGKPGSLPIDTFNKIIRDMVDEHETKWNSGDPKQRFDVLEDYNYGETSGKSYLKDVLANRLREKDNVDVSADDIVILLFADLPSIQFLPHIDGLGPLVCNH